VAAWAAGEAFLRPGVRHGGSSASRLLLRRDRDEAITAAVALRSHCFASSGPRSAPLPRRHDCASVWEPSPACPIDSTSVTAGTAITGGFRAGDQGLTNRGAREYFGAGWIGCGAIVRRAIAKWKRWGGM
jgi:hypothetical protein